MPTERLSDLDGSMIVGVENETDDLDTREAEEPAEQRSFGVSEKMVHRSDKIQSWMDLWKWVKVKARSTMARADASRTENRSSLPRDLTKFRRAPVGQAYRQKPMGTRALERMLMTAMERDAIPAVRIMYASKGSI